MSSTIAKYLTRLSYHNLPKEVENDIKHTLIEFGLDVIHDRELQDELWHYTDRNVVEESEKFSDISLEDTVETLRKKGYKVAVYHRRIPIGCKSGIEPDKHFEHILNDSEIEYIAFKDNDNVYPTISYSRHTKNIEVENNGGKTSILILSKDEIPTQIGEGSSVCHVRDLFSYKKGVSIALQRAIESILKKS